MTKETKRINMNIPLDTLALIDEYAQSMSINRTSAILVLVNLSLNSQKAMSDLNQLMKLYQSNMGAMIAEGSEPGATSGSARQAD